MPSLSALEQAEDFLRAELADGARAQRDIQREASGAGINRHTLQRAKQNLRIVSIREGARQVGAHWVWRLPSHSPTPVSE